MINTPILYQGNTVWVESECAWFSILWALLRMKPDTDYVKIGKEIIAEDWNSMGFMRAINWFIKKGYVKGYKKCIYTPFISKKYPIITTLYSVDWIETWKPPYKLTYKPKGTWGAHLVCIDSLWKIANSWWESFGDKWYFYFTPDQVKTFGQCFYLVI